MVIYPIINVLVEIVVRGPFTKFGINFVTALIHELVIPFAKERMTIYVMFLCTVVSFLTF